MHLASMGIDDMAELVAALAAFVLTHLIPAYAPVRNLLIGALGKGLYGGIYSLVSIAVIVWLSLAYGDAP